VIAAAVAECHALHIQELYLGSEVKFQFAVSISGFPVSCSDQRPRPGTRLYVYCRLGLDCHLVSTGICISTAAAFDSKGAFADFANFTSITVSTHPELFRHL